MPKSSPNALGRLDVSMLDCFSIFFLLPPIRCHTNHDLLFYSGIATTIVHFGIASTPCAL
jgi:hypothetical protein